LVSSRVRTSVKEPFLRKINQGGLLMLNELLLRYGAPGIKYVLELCADRQRHPVGFYCTAGKDRTGMIAAIILTLCGVDRQDIIRDYSLSANVYAEMNDHQAMVGALSQRSLDPKTFLGAPASVMRETLEAIEKTYGSVEGYCDWIGFGPEKREQLRRACMDD
jgi:protein tyrosine/serine phosphatase